MKHIITVTSVDDHGNPVASEILGVMPNDTGLSLLQTFFNPAGQPVSKRARPVVVLARAEDSEAHESVKPGMVFASTNAASQALGYSFNMVSHTLSKSSDSAVVRGIELNYQSRVGKH